METAVFRSSPLHYGSVSNVIFVAIDRNNNINAFSYVATVDADGFLAPTLQKTALPSGYVPCAKKQGNSETE